MKRVGPKIANALDHKAIKLTLQFSIVVRGLGLWKFKSSHLEDNEFLDLITNNYSLIREKYVHVVDKKLKWELIKIERRGITISFSKRKAFLDSKRELNLQRRLEELDMEICQSPSPLPLDFKLKVKNGNSIISMKIKGKAQCFERRQGGLNTERNQQSIFSTWKEETIIAKL